MFLTFQKVSLGILLLLLSTLSYSKSGFFIEGVHGKTKISENGVNIKSSGNGFNIGYQFNSVVRLFIGNKELGENKTRYYDYYETFDGFSETRASSKLTLEGRLLGIAFDIPLSSRFSLSPELGLYRWNAKSKSHYYNNYYFSGADHIVDWTYSDKESDTDLFHGLSFRTHFSSSALSLGFRRWTLDDITVKEQFVSYQLIF